MKLIPVHGELLIPRAHRLNFSPRNLVPLLGVKPEAISLLIPCYSLFRFWVKFTKTLELRGIPPNIGPIQGAKLKKFPVNSLLNREFGGEGFAADSTHHQTFQRVTVMP